jgi:gliding motility-associated-like protein
MVIQIIQASKIGANEIKSIDLDASDTHSYTLVAGSGDNDNASFEIIANQIKVKELFNFEIKSGYSVRIKTTDAGGLNFENSFAITINNVNELPTAIALSAVSIDENSLVGTVLANLSSTDADVNDTHSYSLVAGTDDTNNASFDIVGNELKVKELFDFEKKSSYSIRLRTTDAGGLSFENNFAITINNVNELPTAIALSANSINENSAIGTTLANLSSTDLDVNDTHTYSLVAGSGDTNNTSFDIVGNELKVKELFDFEKKSSYTLRIRTTDVGGLSFENNFAITINNVNELPTAIVLNANSINENSAIGTTLANLSSTDLDANDTHTYSLVSGSGASNNASFEIVGNELKTKESFNFESKSSYTLRIRTTDAGGLSFENSFSISVTDVNEAPTALAVSRLNLYEGNRVDELIGLMSSTDQDAGDTHTYSLVAGTGSTDNAAFKILNGQIYAAQVFSFDAKNSYSVRVRTTDAGGLSYDQAFTITVSQKPVITGTGNETFPNSRVAASANPSISLGYSSDLFVSGADIVSYNWTPSTGLNSSAISNPTASPKATTTYTVEVTNRFGSKTTLSITVSVREDYNVTPNNILSPNGDGQNDGWIIENLSAYPNNKVTIIDRSGLLIYTKINYTNDWNGTFNGVALPEGTYYYIIALNGGKGEKTGFITIVN